MSATSPHSAHAACYLKPMVSPIHHVNRAHDLRATTVTIKGQGKHSAGRVRRAPQCVSVPPSPPAATRPSKSGRYFVFPPPIFPLVPIFGRRTFRYDVVPGKIWRFEQKQGIGLGLNVAVNVRMTVIKTASGGLFVYAPVAPTAECLALLSELDAPVEYIVLPTTLFEHKLFMGPFSRRFPRAQSFVVPGQWSWPLNLPSAFFGIFNAKPLDDAAAGAALPFSDEFEVQILSPRPVGVSSLVKFNEAAVFHKPTRTLLVTDCVVHVSDTPSEVCAEKELLESGDDNNFVINSLKLLNLFNIREKAKSRTTSSDTMTREERLRLGWQRNTLQALYFGPNNLLDPEESWRRITNRLLVAPVVVTLVYSNCADDVFEWVDRVCQWRFTRIIPCHLDAPIMATPVEFKSAFSVLKQDPSRENTKDRFVFPFFKTKLVAPVEEEYYPPEDVVLLKSVAKFLQDIGVIYTDENRPRTMRDQIRVDK